MNNSEYIQSVSHYKVIELSTVTAETIEAALNKWVPAGWQFDQMQFVVREASRRPSMAFLMFTRPVSDDEVSTFSKHVENPEDCDIEVDIPVSDSEEGEIEWS